MVRRDSVEYSRLNEEAVRQPIALRRRPAGRYAYTIATRELDVCQDCAQLLLRHNRPHVGVIDPRSYRKALHLADYPLQQLVVD